MSRDGTDGQGGFTLIEVAVALAILGWVLGSALALVSQYGDERLRLSERSIGQQVAWNRQMTLYRRSKGWYAETAANELRESATESEQGRRWRWHIEREAAQGEGLWRYQVRVDNAASDHQAASLSAFWRDAGDGS